MRENGKDRRLQSVLLVVAVGDFGKRPHITASAVLLYFRRMFEFDRSFDLKKLTLDKRTCNTIGVIHLIIRTSILHCSSF